MPLSPCPTCGRHVRTDGSSCPHCQAPPATGLTLSSTFAAASLGLALVACSGDTSNVDYGVSPTDDYSDADTDADTDTDTDTDADTDTDDTAATP